MNMISSQEQIEIIKSDLPKNSKVLVAMSGGVDSSLSATLMKRAGFEVFGVTLRMHTQTCFTTDISDAQNVAQKEGFEHHLVDYQKDFKEKIINYFVETYKEGATPSPCTRCNKLIKFEKFNELAEKFGANIIVTGHYVKKIDGNIYKAKHEFKDQSYFLSLARERDLEKTYFPLANLEKPQVRALAQEFGLINAQKKGSKDICFFSTTYNDFLKEIAPEIINQGEICDKNGNILGYHDGIPNYTIGQRKKLGLSGGPWFVTEIDTINNRIIVGTMEDLARSSLEIDEINLLVPEERFNEPIEIKIRARQTPAKGKLDLANKKVYFNEPQYAITPGQVCAFYDANGQLLGGSIITR